MYVFVPNFAGFLLSVRIIINSHHARFMAEDVVVFNQLLMRSGGVHVKMNYEE